MAYRFTCRISLLIALAMLLPYEANAQGFFDKVSIPKTVIATGVRRRAKRTDAQSGGNLGCLSSFYMPDGERLTPGVNSIADFVLS